MPVLRDENMGSKQPSIKKKGFRFQEDGQFWKSIVRSLKWKAFDKYPACVLSSPLLLFHEILVSSRFFSAME